MSRCRELLVRVLLFLFSAAGLLPGLNAGDLAAEVCARLNDANERRAWGDDRDGRT